MSSRSFWEKAYAISDRYEDKAQHIAKEVGAFADLMEMLLIVLSGLMLFICIVCWVICLVVTSDLPSHTVWQITLWPLGSIIVLLLLMMQLASWFYEPSRS